MNGSRTTPRLADAVRPAPRLSILLLVGFVFALEGLLFYRDLTAGLIWDPWLALAPVVWIDAALVSLVLLLWGLSFPRAENPTRGWRSWLAPDFTAIRRAFRSPTFRAWLAGTALGYGVLLLFLQSAIVVDPSGGLLPHGTTQYVAIHEGSLGWGPAVVWAPDPFFGVVLRPYSVAVTVALTTFTAVGLALVASRRRAGVGPRRWRDLAGPAAAAMVMCPACATSPLLAVAAAALVPGALGGAGSVGALVGPLMVLSTIALLLSIVMLWMGIARSSRDVPVPAPAEGITRSDSPVASWGRWLVFGGLLLALGALLADLSAAPIPGGDEGHGVAVVHPPAAFGLAALGFGAFLLGLLFLGLGPRPHLWSRRRALVLAILALLFADGTIHWLAVSEHIGEPTSALFFLGLGAIQMFVAPFALRRERLLWGAAVVLPVLLLALYVVTRLVPSPGGPAPEPIESLGLVSKVVEILMLLASVAYFGRRSLAAGFRDVSGRVSSHPLVLLGFVGTLLVIGAETSWGLLSLLPASTYLMLLLGAVAGIVVVRDGHPLARGAAWVLPSLLTGLHVLFAAMYVATALLLPLLFCVFSASALGAGLALHRWNPRGVTPAGTGGA